MRQLRRACAQSNGAVVDLRDPHAHQLADAWSEGALAVDGAAQRAGGVRDVGGELKEPLGLGAIACGDLDMGHVSLLRSRPGGSAG